jgi:5-methyltetrahydrofolate--homocysteine methyltransferase
MGPFGDFLEPLGLTTADEALAIFREQAQALKEACPDGIIIETMTDAEEMRIAVKAAKETGLPVIATFAFDRADGITHRTMMGQDVAVCMQTVIDEGADVVGANCGKDMDLEDYAKLADAVLAAAKGKPVLIQPNAGAPQMVNGELTYVASPDDMAKLALELVNKGVSIVGGCCGTTPAHLKQIARAVKA